MAGERETVGIVFAAGSGAVDSGQGARWAVGELERALAESGIRARAVGASDEVPEDASCVLVILAASAAGREALAAAGVEMPRARESLAVFTAPLRGRSVTVACGADERGLVYAVLELADRVRCAGGADAALRALRLDRPLVEQPANAIRSIARLFTSEVEDKPWWYDRGFWQEYLTELATHRFNRFALMLGLGYNFPRGVSDAYLHLAYPFLLDVPGYRVSVPGLPEEERDRNLATLRFIGEEVKRRGLHFQLGLWTHAHEWVDSPDAIHTIAGLTPETHAPYCRDALQLLLEQMPTVDGLTFRVHGESGIPEGSYDFWRTVFTGVVAASRRRDRPLEIDMHAKGVDQETIDLALATGLPIRLSAKYWAEHQGLPYHQTAIREIERASAPRAGHMAVSGGERRFTRYGYGDFLREDRQYNLIYRIWPGTQRLLLWGDPVFAAGYGRHASFAGCLGVELCEPLTFKGRLGSGLPGGRNGYADESLIPEGGPAADWKKYRYTYRVWGRGTYGPETDPDGWRRWTRHSFGAAAEDAEAALANASRITLLFTTTYGASANCKILWPELYTNMPILSEEGHPYSDTLRPKRFGNVSPLDPELFASVDEYAAEVVRGEPSGKYSPLDVAGWLEGFATAAARHLAAAKEQIGARDGAEFRRWAGDIAIQSALGRFFAAQLRAATGYALHAQTGDIAVLREALDAYRAARQAYAEAAEAGGVYRSDLTFGCEPHQRGHWVDRLPALDADVARMEATLRAAEATGRTDGTRAGFGTLAGSAVAKTGSRGAVRHTPPASFRRGDPVPLQLQIDGGDAHSVEVRYRHVNQAERYQAAPMTREGGVFRAAIPATYTDSAYPLQYLFVVRAGPAGAPRAWIYPGLAPDLANQPYFLVRQARGDSG